jgi:YebC/PmpR family DNA-binding regulatory protein
MAGHNKWSKIKRKKGVADAARSKVFSRRIKEITVAVKEGGSTDPDFNPRLRTAVLNAKGDNMPKENIERAIKKASESDGQSFMELNYEAYAAGGIALFIECSTDNLNRTVANVRHILTKNGGSMSTSGSVDFLFKRIAQFEISSEKLAEKDRDELSLQWIDAGADDIEEEEDYLLITAPMEAFGTIQTAFDDLKLEPDKAELIRVPLNSVSCDLDQSRQVLKLVDLLEEDDDVQAVYHNLELSEELMAELEL